MSLPVFARGSYAQDQRGRGRVVAYREPVRIAEVAVRPGDLIVGDDDGVLVVPSDVAAECVEKALEKRRMENVIAQEIEAGLSTTEAWEKYGVM
jgi:regulator of RNase E activity RraA